MSSTKVMDRRRSVRVASSYGVTVFDQRGRVVGRGRTGNLSETGVFVLMPGCRKMGLGTEVAVEMELPRSPEHVRQIRQVRYTAKVIREESMGSWRGMGLQLLEKLE